MGIAGTEVAKEASDIILMDDNFSSIVSAIMWGRCVNDSVKKFLQVRPPLPGSSADAPVVPDFGEHHRCRDYIYLRRGLFRRDVRLDCRAAALGQPHYGVRLSLPGAELTPRSTFAALALATDPADPESLQRKPDRKTAPLISVQMWMMIIGQALYQTIVALVLHFAGNAIFGFNSTDTATAIDQQNELKYVVSSPLRDSADPALARWSSTRLSGARYVSFRFLLEPH